MTSDTRCSDCPPAGYPTDKTRCYGCPLANTYKDATGDLVIPTAAPSSKTVTDLEAWIASPEGQRYGCTRQYPHPRYACDHDAKCVGCLMVAAALELRKQPDETTVARTPCDDCLADRNRLSAELEQYKAWHRGGRSNVEFLGDGVRVCNGEHENHEPCQFAEYRRAEESRESADLRHKLAAVLEPHACLPGRVQVMAGKSDTFWSIVQALAGSSVEPTLPQAWPNEISRAGFNELGLVSTKSGAEKATREDVFECPATRATCKRHCQYGNCAIRGSENGSGDGV